MKDKLIEKEFKNIQNKSLAIWPEYKDQIANTSLIIDERKGIFGEAKLISKEDNEYQLTISKLMCCNKSHLMRTMKHEWAHIIDFIERGGSNHNKPWKKIAKKLGLAYPKSSAKPSIKIAIKIKSDEI